MKFFLKIIGVALFNAIVGLLFVFFYGTNLLFSIIVPQVWTLAYCINLLKTERTKHDED
jgi:hypothetical protein